MRTTVLYEDQLAHGTQPAQFVPHLVVLRALADVTTREVHELARDLRAHPSKGKEKVVRELRILSGERSIIVVLDNDRIRDLAVGEFPRPRFTKTTSRQEIEAAFRREFGDSIGVVLLEENMESLVQQVCQLSGTAYPESKPSPEERDELLKPALRDAKLRRELLTKMPSFERLVEVARLHFER